MSDSNRLNFNLEFLGSLSAKSEVKPDMIEMSRLEAADYNKLSLEEKIRLLTYKGYSASVISDELHILEEEVVRLQRP